MLKVAYAIAASMLTGSESIDPDSEADISTHDDHGFHSISFGTQQDVACSTDVVKLAAANDSSSNRPSRMKLFLMENRYA